MQRSQWTEHFEKVDRALRQILQPGPIRPTNELRSPAQREFRSRVRGRRLTVLVFVLTILIYFLCAPAGMLGAVFLTLKVAARIYPAAHAQPALVAFMVLDSIYVVLLGRVLWIASLVLWLVLIGIGISRKSMRVAILALLALGWLSLAAYGIRVPHILFP